MALQIPFFQIDAFTHQVFKGNAAVVMVLPEWPSDDILLAAAQEHNQSETAFLVKTTPQDYELRWFTPAAEVDLCGHATLAAAYVIFNELGFTGACVRFKTRFAGDLSVTRQGAFLELDFPARIGQTSQNGHDILALLNVPVAPVDMLRTERDWYFVFETEDQIRAAKPDFAKLSLTNTWQCITAPGRDSDFVSRFFTANAGITEDPVTGSTHCTLTPYWAARLNKTELTARQLSARGGDLRVSLRGDRVGIAGQARLYARGYVLLP